MIITHELTLDLKRADSQQKLEMKQGDSFSRAVTLNLTQDGIPWTIPEGVAVLLRYSRSDGTAGIYDTLPDGGRAWQVSGNAVTVTLVPQMLAVSGPVWADLVLILGEEILSTFRFWIEVAHSVADSVEAQSQGYYKVASLDSINKWLNELEDRKLERAGDKLEGSLNMDGHRLTGLPWPEKWTDAVSREYVDQKLAQLSPGTGTALQTLPDYWTDHLHGKIDTVRRLQEEGGKDCFSFVVLTDLQAGKNLGGYSPALIAQILEACQIPYALLLGNVRQAGTAENREEARRELEDVNTMLLPLRGRVLQTQGQNDAGFGLGDYDGDGMEEPHVYELSPGEVFEGIYRKNGLVGEIHMDESGTAFYADDWGNRVRYLLLNTHQNAYHTESSGMVKYPSAYIFRFTQTQFDFVIDQAIGTMPDEDWTLVVGCHVPMNQTGEMPDGELMTQVLCAYRNKTAITGEYSGAGAVGPEFTSQIDPAAEGYVTGMRYRSDATALESNASYFTTNYISCQVDGDAPDVLRLSGMTRAQLLLCSVALLDENKAVLYGAKAVTDSQNDWVEELGTDGLGTGVWCWDVGALSGAVREELFGGAQYLQVSIPVSCQNTAVVTVNESITYTTEPYDLVRVDADFTEAKGTVLCCFCGHMQSDGYWYQDGLSLIATRCDAAVDADPVLLAERVEGTVTEQSFDVVTVNKKTGMILCTKIGAGEDRSYKI